MKCIKLPHFFHGAPPPPLFKESDRFGRVFCSIFDKGNPILKTFPLAILVQNVPSLKKYVYAFFYLDFLKKPCYHDITIHALYFLSGRKVQLSDESVLPVTKKEGKGKEKWTIGPRMKMDAKTIAPFPSPISSSQLRHSRLMILPLSLDKKKIVHAS